MKTMHLKETGNLREMVAPVKETVTSHLPDHLPARITDHLPGHLAAHLPGHTPRRGLLGRAGEHRRGLLAVGLVALVGGVVGLFLERRRHETVHAVAAEPAQTGAAGSSGGYADRGADDGFGGAAIGGTAEVSEGPYGVGSAAPLPDGGAPGAAYTIKGDVETRTFHTHDSPDYAGAAAGVWFADAGSARAAGFSAWDDK